MLISCFLPLLLLVAGSEGDTPPAAPPVLLLNAWDCTTLADLHAWREHRDAEIAKYVPKEFQPSSIRSMQREFDERSAQLVGGAAVGGESSVFIAEEPTKALPVFLPSQGRYSTEEDLAAWRAREDALILALVPDDHVEIARGSLSREYEQRSEALLRGDASPIGAHVGGRLPALLFFPTANGANSIAELETWRTLQATRTADVVPQAYQSHALASISQEYAKHLERLRSAEAPAAPAAATVLSGEGEPHADPATRPADVSWAAFGALAAAMFAALAAAGRRRRGVSSDEAEGGGGYTMVV